MSKDNTSFENDEVINSTEITECARIFTTEFFKGLEVESVTRVFNTIVDSLKHNNASTGDAFAAMIAAIVTRITDSSYNPTIKDVLVHAASVHMAFSYMLAQDPRLKGARQAVVTIDPLGPLKSEGDEDLPELRARRIGAIERADEDEIVVENGVTLELDGDVSPEAAGEVIARHMKAMREELEAMSEATFSKKH